MSVPLECSNYGSTHSTTLFLLPPHTSCLTIPSLHQSPKPLPSYIMQPVLPHNLTFLDYLEDGGSYLHWNAGNYPLTWCRLPESFNLQWQHGNLGSIPAHSVKICVGQHGNGRGFLHVIWFSPGGTNSPMLHTHSLFYQCRYRIFTSDRVIDTQNQQHCKNLELHKVKIWLGRTWNFFIGWGKFSH